MINIPILMQRFGVSSDCPQVPAGIDVGSPEQNRSKTPLNSDFRRAVCNQPGSDRGRNCPKNYSSQKAARKKGGSRKGLPDADAGLVSATHGGTLMWRAEWKDGNGWW